MDLVAVLQGLVFTFLAVLEGSIAEALLLDALATTAPAKGGQIRACDQRVLYPIISISQSGNHFDNDKI